MSDQAGRTPTTEAVAETTTSIETTTSTETSTETGTAVSTETSTETGTAAKTATATGTGTSTPRRPTRARGRWLRLVVPPGLVLVLVILSGLAYWLQQPDISDRAYLSPTSTADIGARRLAERLAARGIRVDRTTKTSDAIAKAAKGDATLFVPTPSLAHPDYLKMIDTLPSSTRVVLVAPATRTLSDAAIDARATGRRLAARVATPGADCRYAPATRAGSAAVFRTRYRSDVALHRCYHGALLVVRSGEVEVTVVGADDPFRNDRIGEHHNAALATELLAGAPRVVWLDLHRLDTGPRYDQETNGHPGHPSSSPDADETYSGRSGEGEPGGDTSGPGRPGGAERSDVPDTDEPSSSASGDNASNPLWDTFPAWVFAAFALVVLAVVLLALAAGRRLGGPVREPLPVSVRASETVQGRGRLYQRAKARGASVDTLRASARQRLIHLLDLAPDADRDTLVTAAARHAAWERQTVEWTLFGPEPEDDRQLVRTALAVERLLQAVTRGASSPTVASKGEPR